MYPRKAIDLIGPTYQAKAERAAVEFLWPPFQSKYLVLDIDCIKMSFLLLQVESLIYADRLESCLWERKSRNFPPCTLGIRTASFGSHHKVIF